MSKQYNQQQTPGLVVNQVLGDNDAPANGTPISPPADAKAPGNVDNLAISVAGAPPVIILGPGQVEARNIFLQGALSKDTVVEFPAINRSWKLVDQTERNGFTLSAKKSGGVAKPVLEGGTVDIFAELA